MTCCDVSHSTSNTGLLLIDRPASHHGTLSSVLGSIRAEHMDDVALCCRDGKTIVFFSTKHSAHRAKILFGLAGLPPSAELHGNMTQAARLESLERFRKVLTPHLSSAHECLCCCFAEIPSDGRC